MNIYFDMDGTLCDFYAVKGWLADLENNNPRPYKNAIPMVNLPSVDLLRAVQKAGHKVCILSWLSKCGTPDFMQSIAQVKLEWLSIHFPDFQFDAVHIIPYGVSKHNWKSMGDILFDDEERNRSEWGQGAYLPSEILTVLEHLK